MWSLPAVPLIADQAAERGEMVPVGKSAHSLRLSGYLVDVHVADDAVLMADPKSPTGYWWRGAYNHEYALLD